jgi:hypothetical protein
VLRFANSPVILVDGVDVGGGEVESAVSSTVGMTSGFGPDAHVFYTLDGSTPDFTSTSYSGAFTITNTATLRAVAYNAAFTESAEAAAITVQVRLDPPSGPYAFGSTVQLTALPLPGPDLVGWGGAAIGATHPVHFTISSATLTIAALFGSLKSNEVALTVLTSGGGTVTVEPARHVYTTGATVTLTATPGTGYRFNGWSGDLAGPVNPLVMTLDGSTLRGPARHEPWAAVLSSVPSVNRIRTSNPGSRATRLTF